MTMQIPGNASFIVGIISNVSNFKILEQEQISKFLQDNVFSRVQWLHTLLIKQGTFVACIIVQSALIVVVAITMKVPGLKNLAKKLRDEMMWAPVFRSQIQTFFPACLTSFITLRSIYKQYNLSDLLDEFDDENS